MAKTKTNVELKRVNMNLPKSLVDKVEEYGYQVGINTTNAYIFLLYKGLEGNIPFANINEFENEFVELVSENIIQNDKMINKLVDVLNDKIERK